jgi:hypothetical protein
MDDILDSFLEEYDLKWFQNAKDLFYKHPSNENRQSTFWATEYDFGDGNSMEVINFEIDLAGFVYGKKDQRFDDTWDEKEANEKLETKLDARGNVLVYKEIEGTEYISSSSFYPPITFNQWETDFFLELESYIPLLSTLYEKEKFFNYLTEHIRNVSNKCKEVKDEEYKQIVSVFLGSILESISGSSKKIKYLQGIVGHYEETIKMDISQAQLARLIFFLVNAKYIKHTPAEACRLFQKFFQVKSGSEYKKALTLSSAYNSHIKSHYDWVKKQKLQL